MIEVTKVKRAGPNVCDCVRLDGRSRLAFDLPAGESLVIGIEDLPSTELAVEISDGGHGFRHALDVGQLGDTWSVIRDGAGWQQAEDSDRSPDTGIAIWWQGEPSRGEDAPEGGNEALREQLEALGYLGG